MVTFLRPADSFAMHERHELIGMVSLQAWGSPAYARRHPFASCRPAAAQVAVLLPTPWTEDDNP